MNRPRLFAVWHPRRKKPTRPGVQIVEGLNKDFARLRFVIDNQNPNARELRDKPFSFLA